MAYKLAYVIFLLYLRPATLRGNPSKVQSQYPATDNYFAQTTKLCKHISFFCQNICTIDFFVVPLQRILITTIFVTTFFVITKHMENPFKFGSIVEDEFFTDRFELEDPFFGEWLVAKH